MAVESVIAEVVAMERVEAGGGVVVDATALSVVVIVVVGVVAHKIVKTASVGAGLSTFAALVSRAAGHGVVIRRGSGTAVVIVEVLVEGPSSSVHEKVCNGGWFEAQLLGYGALHVLVGPLGFSENGYESPPLDVRENQTRFFAGVVGAVARDAVVAVLLRQLLSASLVVGVEEVLLLLQQHRVVASAIAAPVQL